MIDQPVIDGIGYAAAGLVLATFCMNSMSALRLLATASNVAFILYGYLGDFAPILLLHSLLLPINTYMLLQQCLERQRRSAPFTRAGSRQRSKTAGSQF
jgi:CRP/FNR family transcriptional regulator, cyclic AMP receptor protein